jgi:hypothetical protein
MKGFKPYFLIVLATLTLVACGSGSGPIRLNAK